jgi:alkanesulfonate monooxygenase SsuD/methylene tetrahydromethanopterin reductase-like flavin-dependent oxidoreductase (luciferase family)
VEYVTNLMSADADPVAWAAEREAEGWPVLSVADHLFTNDRPYPHVWVTASAMAVATQTATITTAFVNNLFRNPVEVAQAALMMQHVSGGRFELGLGAGWYRAEIEAMGERYPPPGERAGRFVEAVQVVASLVREGSCSFDGSYYNVDIERIGPRPELPPPIVASVGGPRTAREVTPHLDRVEIKASSASTRGGQLDFSAMATITPDHLSEMVERVRAVRPDIPIGMFVLCNVGDDPRTRQVESMLGASLYGRFFGAPDKVADGIRSLESFGISRAQLSPFDDSSFEALSPLLLGRSECTRR